MQGQLMEHHHSKIDQHKMGGADPNAIRISLALCYTFAKCACPVWECSTHAKVTNPVFNEGCQIIPGCLKPTNTNSLYVLAGISPSDIRRAVASRSECTQQLQDTRHPLHNHVDVRKHLKSQKSFCGYMEPLEVQANSCGSFTCKICHKQP